MVTEKAWLVIARNCRAISLARLCLTLILLTSLSFFVAAETSCLAVDHNAASEPNRTVTLNLGSVRSIDVPDSWQLDSSQPVTVKSFSKSSSGLYDCSSSLQIRSPAEISTEQSKTLDALMSQEKLTARQIKLLESILGVVGTSDASSSNSATTSEINGKRVIIIEKNGSKRGPCQRTANGGSRMPLLSFVSGCVLVRVGVDAAQAIQFEVTVMGETKPCVNSVRSSLNSIVWKKQTP